MASLSGLYDPNATPSSGKKTVIPTGEYDVIITGSDVKRNKKNTGDVLHLDIIINGGQFSGETLKHFINLTNTNETAQRIGQSEMAALREATGVDAPQNSEDFHNRPFKVRIEVKPDSFTNDHGELVNFERSEIKAFLSGGSTGNATYGTGVPAQAAPAPAAQQPATPAPGSKPWEKKAA